MTNAKDKPTRAQDICKRYDSLTTELETWRSWWQEIAEYVMPRKAEITRKSTSPNTDDTEQLFTSAAIEANQTLANGMMSMLMPAESPWFSFDPPEWLKRSEAAKDWFSQATDIIRAELSRSNFYTEAHEMVLDHGGFGTAAMQVEAGRMSAFRFTCFDVGSFAVAENDEGHIDTVFRCFELTARQLVIKFGEDAVSSDTRTKASDEKQMDEKIEVLHAIYPRDPESYQPGGLGTENMPIVSCYLERSSKHMIAESGYNEMPVFVTRFLKWGSSSYGWSPSWMALPESRQLNFLTKMNDTLAEVAAYPRMLIPDGLEEDIDVRAHGVTYFNGGVAGREPKEWLTGGRYDIGMDREARKTDAINRAYHVDLFRMFAQLDKQMTAREVAERASEKLVQFSPTATRMTTEFFNPLLQRVWALAVRSGMLPPPPEDIMEQDGEGNFFLPEPNVTFTSRIALAIKGLENVAFTRTFEMIMPVIQVAPETVDNLNFDEITRDLSRNNGLPSHWLRDLPAVEEMRAARAEQQARAQQLEEARIQAEIAQKAGSVKSDSLAAQAAMAQQEAA